jgi:hypothetical protein
VREATVVAADVANGAAGCSTAEVHARNGTVLVVGVTVVGVTVAGVTVVVVVGGVVAAATDS